MPKFSFKFALLLNILLLTLAIGWICASFFADWSEESIRLNKRNTLSSVAGSTALKISELMRSSQLKVMFTRDLMEKELLNASPDEKRKALEKLAAIDSNFTWLGMVEKDGNIAVGTEGLLEGVNLKGRDWFEEGMRKDVFFGNAHTALLLAKSKKNTDGAPLYLLDIALPIRDSNGNSVGVLGSHMNVKVIHEAIRRSLDVSGNPSTVSLAIIDSRGDILFDSANAVGNVGSLFNQGQPDDFSRAVWANLGEPFLLKRAPVPPLGNFNGMGWALVAREPVSVINEEVGQMRRMIAYISAIVGCVYAIVGLLVITWVLKPINVLVNEMQRFGNTRQKPELPAGSIIMEVDSLNSSFGNMATNIIANDAMLKDTQSEIVKALSRAGEFRDNETGNHVTRMSLCCELLFLLVDGDREKAEMIRLASQMHDVGKIGISDDILLKPGKYEPHERRIMENHCEIGARILTGLETPLTVIARTVALTHHEKWDGTGYPNRLAGDKIPLEGRIAALCDVFDALLSSRPYKEGWHPDRVRALIESESGKHFDPALVPVFMENFDKFLEIRSRYLDEKSW